MSLNNLLSEMDGMVLQGQIVEAVDRFFAEDAHTLDFDGTRTTTKAEMLAKMTGFVGAIGRVNGINLHQHLAAGQTTFSEFTFDFNMQDGSRILWHEIIRREWHDNKVVQEQYFKN